MTSLLPVACSSGGCKPSARPQFTGMGRGSGKLGVYAFQQES